jgi:hypothetical protein
VCNTPTEFEQSIETLFHVTTGNFKLDMKFVFVLRILDELIRQSFNGRKIIIPLKTTHVVNSSS